MQQTRRPTEIVVVDSGSTDDTLAIAAAFDVQIVHIAPDDFSFGRALNRGLQRVTGEIAVIASAHVYPLYDSWIDVLTEPFEEDAVALTYGRQEVPEGGRFSEQQLLARLFPPQSIKRQSDPFCNNANAAIRMSVWRGLPYNEELTGLEDVDWATRVLSRGHILSYVAEATVAHVHNESFSQIVHRYRREAIAHKRIYNDQRMSLASALWLGATNIRGDIREASRQGVLAATLRDIPKFRIAQFYGTYRGFRQQGPVPALLRKRFYYPPEAEHAAPADRSATGQPIDYGALVQSGE
jgi:glycosyltransferase involved in cell wall biosynthesis